MKTEIDLAQFKEDVFDNVQHEYGNHNKTFHEELKEEMMIMVRATELFMQGRG